MTRRRDVASLSRRRRLRRLGVRARLALLAVLVLALLVGGGWVLFFSSYLSAQRVSVTGERSVSAAQVRRAAHVPLGTALVRLDLAAIRARVESIPVVRSVQVSRSWPSTVQVSVTERTAVAVVDRGDGLQGVDEAGVLFGHYDRRPSRLPLIRARAGVGAEALAQGARVAAALPARLARRVDHIRLRSPDRIELEMRGGRVVVWGSAAESDRKAEVAAVLLRGRAAGTGGRHEHGKPSVVDVSVPDRPTTRP